MIHYDDNAEVKTKITNDGNLFVYCPECGGVWQTNLNVIHKPKEVREIKYGGTGINLGMGSSGEPPRKKSSDNKEAMAKALFPEAYNQL